MYILEKDETIVSKFRTALARILPFTAQRSPLPFPVHWTDRRKQHEILVGALDQIEEGILIFDNRLRLLLTNRAARLQLDDIGYRTRSCQDLEAVLQSLGRMAQFVPTRPVRTLVSLAGQGEPWQIRLTGEIAACRLICSPLQGGGVTLLFSDIAEKKQCLHVIR